MTNGFIVEILTLLWRYLFRIWINSPVSRKQILLSLILSTSHNGTFIVVLFSGNFFHWSRLKSCSPDKSFSWTFNLLLTNSNRYPFVWSLISKYIKKKKKKEKKNYMLLSETIVLIPGLSLTAGYVKRRAVCSNIPTIV